MPIPHISQDKAKQMLREGMAHGKPLTAAQRGLFGVIASGKRPTRVKESSNG